MLRACVKPLVVGAFREVADAKPSPRSGKCQARAVHSRKFNALRRLVLDHEFGSPRCATEPNLGAVPGAEINAEVAVTVTIFGATGRKAARHVRARLDHRAALHSSSAA